MEGVCKSQELLVFFQNEYIDNGFLYSGSWPYNSLREKGFAQEAIDELLLKGLIQKRNCDDLAYELSVQKRHQLLSEHSLCSRWLEKTGTALLEDIRTEVRNVSLVQSCMCKKDLFVVDTLKRQGDNSKPNKMEVYCPFVVGQIIQVEYDLPNHKGCSGYSSFYNFPGGVAVGEFMVTDLICNLLVDPPVNMIELQSLSAEFNQIHPDAGTMLIFEDIILKRMKNKTPSLTDQIHSASDRTSKSNRDEHAHTIKTAGR